MLVFGFSFDLCLERNVMSRVVATEISRPPKLPPTHHNRAVEAASKDTDPSSTGTGLKMVSISVRPSVYLKARAFDVMKNTSRILYLSQDFSFFLLHPSQITTTSTSFHLLLNQSTSIVADRFGESKQVTNQYFQAVSFCLETRKTQVQQYIIDKEIVDEQRSLIPSDSKRH